MKRTFASWSATTSSRKATRWPASLRAKRPSLAEKQTPDLILLDVMLPGMDGLTVCQRLRASPRTADVAIMMLTAKSEEADIVRGLNLGATDYVTKPFSPKVLLARVRAVLRRKPAVATAEEEEGEDATKSSKCTAW